MTRTELNKFEVALKVKRIELEIASHNRSALIIDTSADELDRIQHRQERELTIGTLDRAAKLLQEVQAAQTRISRGTFGICLDCEESIGIRRLTAVPWATSCIACQEAFDSGIHKDQTTAGEVLVGAER